MYILLYIIANPKTRMCFEVFKPPREYKYVFLPQALMSRKNKQGCPQLFISRAGVFDILLRCGNASNAGRCHFFVSKSNELFIYMLHDQVCADKSKRSFAHISTYKSKENDQVVKSSGTVSAKLVEKQIHMHVQCLPWAHPIRFFSLRRACQAEKIIKSRDLKLLLRKHV